MQHSSKRLLPASCLVAGLTTLLGCGDSFAVPISGSTPQSASTCMPDGHPNTNSVTGAVDGLVFSFQPGSAIFVRCQDANAFFYRIEVINDGNACAQSSDAMPANARGLYLDVYGDPNQSMASQNLTVGAFASDSQGSLVVPALPIANDPNAVGNPNDVLDPNAAGNSNDVSDPNAVRKAARLTTLAATERVGDPNNLVSLQPIGFEAQCITNDVIQATFEAASGSSSLRGSFTATSCSGLTQYLCP